MSEQLSMDLSEPAPPWLNPNKPRWWRIQQLILAADTHAASFISLRRNEYAASIQTARVERDAFVAKWEKQVVWLGVEKV